MAILNEHFQQRWAGATPTGDWERLQGAWECLAPGEIRVTEPTKLLLFFAERPVAVWEVRLEGVRGEAALYVEADEYAFDLGGRAAPASRIFQSWGATVVLAATGCCPRSPDSPHDLTCRRGDGRVALLCDEAPWLQADDPAPDQDTLSLTVFLPAGIILSGITVSGGARNSRFTPVRVPARATFALDVCVDFLDDLSQAAWTPETLDAVMRYYRQNGVRRIHYIFAGGFQGGFYDRRALEPHRPGVQAKIDRTHAQLGEFMPAFFAAAHDQGMQTVAVFKPFETAMGYTLPHGSAEARKWGKIPSLGGMLWWAMQFTAEHPELRMERNPADLPPDLDQRIVGRIVLRAEPGLPLRLAPERLRLWASADNGRYRPVDIRFRADTGPDGAQWLVADELALRAPFLALTCEPPSGHTFGNRLADLFTVYDHAGRRLPMTLAFSKGRGIRSDFRCDGFDFDSAGATCLENFHWLDTSRPLAFAIGHERYISGALCPAYAAVQDWWMSRIEQCIAAGADAVDIRLHHHNRALDWGAYHFNEPVVRAFQDRHGVDIRTQPFDREALRCLQGSIYTDFLRRARRRLRQAGRAMHAHLEMRMYPPHWPTYMEIRFPWQQWVAEGLVDAITLKSFRTLRSGVALKAIAQLRRETDLRINACPYLNDLVGRPIGPELLNFFIQDALSVGVDGFTLYENAAILRGLPAGGMQVTHPWVVEALTRHAAR